MKKNFNVTIIIAREDFYRNFFKTNAFKDLDSKFNVSYLLSNDLPKTNSERKVFFFEKNQNSKTNRRFSYRTFLLMNRAKNKSKTFQFRVERMLYPLKFNINYIPKFKFLKKNDKLKKIIFFFLKVILNNLKYLKLKILSSEIIFKIFSDKFYYTKKENKIFETKLAETNPDIIIVPFGSQELILPQVINFCKKSKVLSYFITDNWDNLSSKSVLEDKPDFIGVWGEQAKNHAIEIQNFRENQVIMLGSPRFDIIYEKRDQIIKNDFKFNYILFLGHLFDWNEENVIELLDNEISSRIEFYQNTKIIYRPHPQRIGRLRKINLKNIIIDEDLKETGTYWPSLDNYFKNIKNSLFVVGSLTTGLLEASAFNKRYMLICYDDDDDFFSQGSILKKFTHLQGIERIDTIEFCDMKDKVILKFRDLFEKSLNTPNIEISKQLDFFITGDINNTFRKNISRSIYDIFSKSQN